MELSAYARIVRRRWWVQLLAVGLTLAGTYILTRGQVPVYQSKATFVLKLAASFTDDKGFVSALDILSRRAEIAATYTEVATSRLIKRQAADELNLPPAQRSDLHVSSRVVGGTNVLEIQVESSDRDLAQTATNEIGAKTTAYVESLYTTYQLQLLDEATRPNTPVRPDMTMNLVLGAVLGLALGLVWAFVWEYLSAPSESLPALGIIDTESGVYTQRYFMLRLRQEMSRAVRNDYPLSVAVINVDHQGLVEGAPEHVRSAVLRQVAGLVAPYLREEDIMAQVGALQLGFVLPDLGHGQVKQVMERVRVRVAEMPLQMEGSGLKLRLHVAAGIAVFEGKKQTAEELLERAMRALVLANAAAFGRIHVLSPVDGDAVGGGWQRPGVRGMEWAEDAPDGVI